jgi:class 3 adenylate cyclase
MTARTGKTAIASTVFIDIVGYSRARIAQQIAMKVYLNGIVGEAIANVPEADRIIVDTGDGMALCLLGEPEEALFIATEINDGARRSEGAAQQSLRTGIHLGPIKLVRDLNGRPNVLGDGINFAQRIMSFAEDGQVLVSRAYFEVVSRLDEGNDRLFSYLGVRHDKHIQEHQVYAVTVTPSRGARHHVAPDATAAHPSEVAAYRGVGTDPDAPSAGDGGALTEAMVEAEKHRLATLIGPLAEMLVGRAAARADSAQSFYQNLAAAIPDPRDRDRFIAGIAADIRPVPAGEGGHDGPPPVFEAEQLAATEGALAAAIGPLAKTLIRREAARARSLDDLYDRLATYIDNAPAKKRFLEQRSTRRR